MRKRVAILFAFCLLTAATIQAQTPMENYCVWPQFLSSGAKPNVLVLMDNSASMHCRAYASQAFNPGKEYYGFFDPTKWYTHGNSGFVAVAGSKADPKQADYWDGSFLNYVGMRRLDVLRKALIGGDLQEGANTLVGENSDGSGTPGICTGDTAWNTLLEDASQYTPYSGSSASEQATAANMNNVQNTFATENLTPAFVTAGGSATAANISWDLSGNTDLDLCTQIILTAPTTATLTLKDFGENDPVSVDILTFYNTNGAGTYSIRFEEQAGCDTNPRKASLQDISMVVNSGATQACFHYEGGAFTIDPNDPATCVTAANQGDNYGILVSTDANNNGTVDESDPDGDALLNGVYQNTQTLVRWGLEQFDTGNGGGYHGGDIIAPVEDNNPTSFRTQVMNEGNNASTVGTLAEAVRTAIAYYQQDFDTNDLEGPRYDNGDFNNGQGDPFNSVCQQPYLVIITDGEPDQDSFLPQDFIDISDEFAGTCDNLGPSCVSSAGVNAGGVSDCCVDNATLWGRADIANSAPRDLRADLSGIQQLTTFMIFAFGEGSETMKIAARNGGFEDSNGNWEPDVVSEWDKDGDGFPDNYFEAQDGSQIEAAITKVIEEILKRSASATSATVLASGEGQGANLLQAFFFPKKTIGTSELEWVGYLQNLWYYVDPFLALSGIREDTEDDLDLVLPEDDMLEFRFDTGTQEAVADLFLDTTAPFGEKDDPSDPRTIPIENVLHLWEAGEELFLTDPADRKIYTTFDVDGVSADFAAFKYTGTAPTTPISTFFDTDNTAPFVPNFLQAQDTQEAQDIIDYVRGTPVAGYRERETTITELDGSSHTWKLGDIVTSTAKIQANAPLNGYDRIYNDGSYRTFITSDDYKNRGMVYVGANDGMFHAFKLGVLDFTVGGNVKARLTNPGGLELGREEWAYIPKNAMPYLRYLGDPDYCHLFYVDGTPLVFDAAINVPASCSSAYPNCEKKTTLSGNALDLNETSWRTVVIGSMRLGGACGCSTGNCVETSTAVDGAGNPIGTSAYFAIDVTDPDSPDLLWEFTDPDLGFTTTGATIVRMLAEDGNGDEQVDLNGHWFVVIGSGPTGPIEQTARPQFLGKSDQNLRYFILDLKTGALLREVDTGIEDAFSGNMRNSTLDIDKDYEDDFVYGGFTEQTGNTADWFDGGVMRITTRGSLDPDDWTIHPVVNDTGAITGSLASLFTPTSPGTPPTELWIFGGTGRFWFNNSTGFDDTDSQRHIFGFKEPCSADFNDVTVDCTTALDFPDDFFDATVAGYAGAPQDIDGWKIDLDGASGNVAAERMITNPLPVFAGAVLFTTTQPTGDECAAGGNTFLWAIQYNTGLSGASVLFGNALVQTSTGAIGQETLGGAETIFTDKVATNEPTSFVNPDGDAQTYGRRSGDPIIGLSTSDTPPAVILPAPYKRIISVIEK